MKVTVNVDCSPEEARTFLGLPDVQPMQAEMIKIMREKMLDGLKMMEPGEAMNAWMPLMTQGAQQFQDMFSSVMTGAAKSAMSGKTPRK
jgi:hypothetical protein